MKDHSERKSESLSSQRTAVLLISARSDIGGGPKYLDDFAHALLSQEAAGGKLQADQLFIASPEELPYGPRFKALGGDFFPLPHRAFSLRVFFSLLRFSKKNRVSVIHSHGRGAGVYSRLLKPFGFQVVHTYHGIHQDPSFLGRIKLLVDRILHSWTDAFVFVSKSEKEEAIRIGLDCGRSARIIPPLAPTCRAGGTREYHAPIRLGCIARFDYQKGLDLLFGHLSEFQRLHPELDWAFTLAGGKSPLEGSNREFQVPENIRSRVKEIGITHAPLDFLRDIDIYLSSSRWEGLPITILEAISQGIPVLLSNVRGHEYFIDQQVSGGFQPNDSTDFSNQLFKLMSEKKPSPHFEWVEKYHREMNVSQLYDSLFDRSL